MSDPTVYEIAETLLASIESTVTVTPKMRRGITTGEATAWDDCCNGQLTISISPTFPSSNFPAADSESVQCGPLAWATVLTVLILRCAPTVSQSGKAPSVASVNASAKEVSDDAEAVLKGITCVFTSLSDIRHLDVMIGLQTFVGPEGGCVGSVVPVTIGYVR